MRTRWPGALQLTFPERDEGSPASRATQAGGRGTCCAWGHGLVQRRRGRASSEGKRGRSAPHIGSCSRLQERRHAPPLILDGRAGVTGFVIGRHKASSVTEMVGALPLVTGDTSGRPPARLRGQASERSYLAGKAGVPSEASFVVVHLSGIELLLHHDLSVMPNHLPTDPIVARRSQQAGGRPVIAVFNTLLALASPGMSTGYWARIGIPPGAATNPARAGANLLGLAPMGSDARWQLARLHNVITWARSRNSKPS